MEDFDRWVLNEAIFAIDHVRARVLSKHGYVLGLTGSVLIDGEGRDLDLLALPARADSHDPVLVANDIFVLLLGVEWLVFDTKLEGEDRVRGFVFSVGTLLSPGKKTRLVDLSIVRCSDGSE